MEERFITSTLNHRDESFETSIRPERFADFPGQDDKKAQLEISVKAASQRGDALGHLLLSGPPGLGKTTLAHIISHEMGKNIRTSSGPVRSVPRKPISRQPVTFTTMVPSRKTSSVRRWAQPETR